jgi:hypothetical protein
VTTTHAALSGLLLSRRMCAACERPATFGVDPNSKPSHCRGHALASHESVHDAREVEAAEAALAAPLLEVVIEPWDTNSGMSRICVDGIDHNAVDANTVSVVTKVAEALGARVVRRS